MLIYLFYLLQSIGLGLVEPSPPVSFSPSRETSGKTPKGLCVKASPDECKTHNIGI